MADVEKAHKKGQEEGVDVVLQTILYILKDKHGASNEDLKTLFNEFRYVMDSMVKGYLTLADIKWVLGEEYSVTCRLV